ncbi:cytochrome oxidase assembly protein SHY1 NDAI_0G01070 [Naumovozyma dairenensis CBS 421]|uniref:SURF1-like protein n=1 Tax=Naumovozyma dairenensis (strain ATCC 10597 / BCRC 20456 / CBS 421 / NBRC 0211 / NRRL Y-12639) TaxID=1071378 RepID=G0WDM2_NAUDC|nr:hypothetical protein NDAI_0G01070 [Naumovozyma dairenensis CBS 421]CCD25883.2 hypothetical protein NDAI_0G01070 [Naumovozyma dairenensis CBS 421]
MIRRTTKLLTIVYPRIELIGPVPLRTMHTTLPFHRKPQSISRRNHMSSTVDWKPIKTHHNPNEDPNLHDRGIGRKIALGLMIAMPVISFYLGTWQLRRLKWKTRLIATCETKLTYEPIPLPKNFTVDMCEDWEYRKVILKGEFLHDQEMFVGPRSKNGTKGYLLFTPFIRADTGEKVMIERGWIAEEKIPPENRTLHHLSLPQGKNVEVVCMVRPPKERGQFQWAKEDKNSRLWQVADVWDMAKTSGCAPIHFQAIYDMKDHPITPEAPNNFAKQQEQLAPFWKFWAKKDIGNHIKETQVTVASEKPLRKMNDDDTAEFNEFQFIKAGVPIGKKPTIDLRNAHLQYLVTWYGLSLLSTVFLIIAIKKYWKRGVVSPEQLKKDKLKHAKKYM